MNYSIDFYNKTIAIINLIQFLLLIPNYKLIFAGERFGGYLYGEKNSFKHESMIVISIWILLNSLLLLEIIQIYVSIILLCICYYYFILHRFNSISRGMGAPGYFTFLASIAICNATCLLV